MNIVAKQGTRLALVADGADLHSPVCETQVYDTATGTMGSPCRLYRLVANGGWELLDRLEPFVLPITSADITASTLPMQFGVTAKAQQLLTEAILKANNPKPQPPTTTEDREEINLH